MRTLFQQAPHQVTTLQCLTIARFFIKVSCKLLPSQSLWLDNMTDDAFKAVSFSGLVPSHPRLLVSAPRYHPLSTASLEKHSLRVGPLVTVTRRTAMLSSGLSSTTSSLSSWCVSLIPSGSYYSLRFTVTSTAYHIAIQVAYQRILQLTYVEDLLAALKSVFLSLYEPFLASFVASVHGKFSSASQSITLSKGVTINPDISTWDFSRIFEGWDKTFDKVLKRIEEKVSQDRKARIRSVPKPSLTQPSPPSSTDGTATSTFSINIASH